MFQYSLLSIVRIFVITLLANWLLSACNKGVDSLNEPIKPQGHIIGHAVDSAISGGTVSIYSFVNGVRGEKLGSGTTDDAGAFNVDLYSPSQIVLVEVTGGSYVEEASGTTVQLKTGESLSSLVSYQLENTVSTNITPLTHMATALAEYKIENGATVEQAMDDAFGTINGFFGIDSRGTNSVNITKEKSGPVATLGDDVLYGFYMAGLSHWTMDASRKNNVPAHTTYTSMGLAQIMYNDISSDGLLNGQGYNSDKTQMVALALGPSVPLNADEYRLAFSIHMLAMANLTMNKTGLGVPELTDVANSIADKTSSTTTLLDTAQPVDINARDIKMALVQSKDGFYHGIFDFNLSVDGILGIDKIEVQVDGGLANDALVGDPLEQPIQIDTTHYADAQHDISVQVWNALGYTDTLVFTTQFDNTGPIITPIDNVPALTNVTSLPLSFSVDAGFASLQSVDASTNGNNTALSFSGGQWHATLPLTPGENTFSITAIDMAGNETPLNKAIFVDQIPPVIDTGAGHSEVQLSNGDGTSYTGVLANDNLSSAPLYLETDYAGFNTYGKAFSRTTLNSDKIPYFAFTISDERATGVATRAEDMSVRLQYQRSDVILNDWHELSVQPQCKSGADTTVITCEYLIPLLSEILDPPQDVVSPWQETTPQQPHYLRIELNDGAGNTVTAEFSFKVDFYVPSITINAPVDLGDDVIANYTGSGFSNRDTLMSGSFEFDSTQYSLINPSNKPIFIRLADAGNHTAIQTLDKWQREHEVEKTTTYQWQVQEIVPTSNSCPSSSAWFDVSQIYDFNGTSWDLLSKPLPVNERVTVLQDTLPPLSDSGWSDVLKDDNEHASTTFQNTNGTWTYSYDYALTEPLVGTEPVAYLANWSANIGGSLRTCVPTNLERYFFQQKEVYTYALLNGPIDVLTTLTPTQTAFNTSGFTVLDDTGTEIIATSGGWYLIPANAQITIRKKITTPMLTVNEASFTSPASYTVSEFRDRSIEWDVNRDITITAIHDAGAANIDVMSKRDTISDTGTKAYIISRQ